MSDPEGDLAEAMQRAANRSFVQFDDIQEILMGLESSGWFLVRRVDLSGLEAGDTDDRE